MRTSIKLAAAVPTAAAIVALAACGSGSSSTGAKADPNKPLTIAASPTPHADILTWVQKNLAPKAGLKLNIKEFSDYVQPNTAVQDGSADANYFQHQPYLDQFNKDKGTDIVSVEAVHLEPLGAYSKKVESLTALASGATVAVPNDATNEARALKLLADNGLLKLKAGAGVTATTKDITANPKNLKFKALEAAQLPRALDDVDAAVINGNYAIGAKLNPSKDALVLEKAAGNPYANILAVKKGNESDPRIKKLAKLLHSPELKKHLEETYQGSVVPAF